MSTGERDKPRSFMALPDRVGYDRPLFHWYLAEVLGLAGGELPPGPGPADLDQFEWEHAARAAVIASLPQEGPWPEPVFDALMRAIVHDPNPSFNRQLIDPAMAAAGRRAVQVALLGMLATGTNSEKAGAARAWYWANAYSGTPGLKEWRARFVGNGGISVELKKELADLQASWQKARQREAVTVADLRARWREAALREFVSNEDLDVRRCILPGLSLKPADYPDDLKHLAATAIRIARTHPDEYIRHRVEHQV
jgi:hypothetical protein